MIVSTFVCLSNVPEIIEKHEDKCIGAKSTSEREVRPFPLSTPCLFISVFNFLLSQLALCCSVFQLYPLQENVWYLYQLLSRRSEQQSTEDNASLGINNLQGNGPGPTGFCFKILKMGEVPHVKNRKWGPVESASLHTVLIPALQLPVRGFHSSLPTSCV